MTPDDPDFWRRALQHHRPEPYPDPDPEETTMTDQFIDRAKLEAEAFEYAPDIDNNNLLAVHRAAKREAFMAGVDAANARMVRSAGTEWGIKLGRATYEPCDSHLQAIAREEQAHKYLDNPDAVVVSRRVLRTAWVPSEETER